MDDSIATVYRTNGFVDLAVVRPQDMPPAAGILGESGSLGPIGIAFPTAWLTEDHPAGRPAGTAWRLVVHNVEVPGRFVLRRGTFMALRLEPQIRVVERSSCG